MFYCTQHGSNAVELGGGMKQADRRRRIVREISLNAFLRGEVRVAHPFYRAGAGALPARRIRALGDFLNRLPGCFLQLPRGKKPPARSPGGGQRGARG